MLFWRRVNIGVWNRVWQALVSRSVADPAYIEQRDDTIQKQMELAI